MPSLTQCSQYLKYWKIAKIESNKARNICRKDLMVILYEKSVRRSPRKRKRGILKWESGNSGSKE
jgi:hypothetical protein